MESIRLDACSGLDRPMIGTAKANNTKDSRTPFTSPKKQPKSPSINPGSPSLFAFESAPVIKDKIILTPIITNRKLMIVKRKPAKLSAAAAAILVVKKL